jgi:hypothetical protein
MGEVAYNDRVKKLFATKFERRYNVPPFKNCNNPINREDSNYSGFFGYWF